MTRNISPSPDSHSRSVGDTSVGDTSNDKSAGNAAPDSAAPDGAAPIHSVAPDGVASDSIQSLTHPGPERQARWSGKTGLAVGLGVGLLVGAIAFGRRDAPPAVPETAAEAAESTAPAQAVTVAAAELGTIALTLETSGTVEAYDLLPILPRTSGLQVQQVLVDEGDTVVAGQVMAVLDRAVVEAQLAESRANLEAAQARVQQQEAARVQANARLAEARTQVERYASLASEGAISAEALDTRTTTAATAQEDVQVAQATLSSAKADVRSQQAAVAQLQTQLERTQVKAPAAGRVAERMARVGDVTSSSDKLFSIIRDRLLELQVAVPETQLPQVSVGAPVTITSDADPRIQIQGSVREIAPLVNSETREAIVSIDLPPSDLLRPGMFLRAAIATASSAGLTVPAQAVIPRSDGGATVYRTVGEAVGEGQPGQGQRDEVITVEAVTVELGELLDSADPARARIEIRQGLAAGDRVVVQGAGYVNDGDVVDVVSDPSSP